MSGTAEPTERITDRGTSSKAPLDDVMLAMDVVDTLRHRQDLVQRELAGVSREQQLIEQLREIYQQQGITVPDSILKEGVAALDQSRFTYEPPKPGLSRTLARFYVNRKSWLPPVAAIVGVVLVALIGFFGVYQPYQSSVRQAAEVELTEGLPAQMDALYQSIFEETKVQKASTDAEAIRSRGKIAASEGDRAGAQAAVTQLTALRDTLRQEYSLRVTSRPGVQTGVWTIPEINTAATNYYIVVEAIDPQGKPLSMPILNEESQQTETVNIWAVRVPENVYRMVETDKRDDGIVQRNIVGLKQYGFLDIDYAMPVLGGAITRW